MYHSGFDGLDNAFTPARVASMKPTLLDGDEFAEGFVITL